MKIKENCEVCKVPISKKVAETYKNLCKECWIEPTTPLVLGNHVGGYARYTQMLENGDADND